MVKIPGALRNAETIVRELGWESGESLQYNGDRLVLNKKLDHECLQQFYGLRLRGFQELPTTKLPVLFSNNRIQNFACLRDTYKKTIKTKKELSTTIVRQVTHKSCLCSSPNSLLDCRFSLSSGHASSSHSDRIR